MSDASFWNAGYALMIEHYPDQTTQSDRKSDASVAFGSNFFSPVKVKKSIFSKRILAVRMAFSEFAHILWETRKPKVVLTDNISVTSSSNENNSSVALESLCLSVAISK